MSLPVAILAGGLATRLYPLTKKTPKSLLKVAGEYFIIHQLRYLHQQGISHVVLCLGHMGGQIETVVGNGAVCGVDVRYSYDGSRLLGTGGALKQALPLLGETFFVLYGDSYLPIDFSIIERNFYEGGKQALMTVFRNKNQWDKSNVLLHENLIIEYNKHQPKLEMEHIDYGLSILSASLLENILAEEPFDLADLYHELSLRKELLGYEISERFYEIGSFHGLNEVIDLFSKEKI